MSEARFENAVCDKCGVDVRENTSFCFNCGNPVTPIVKVYETEESVSKPGIDAATQAALDDLAEKFRIDETADEKLAKAAAERKKARVSQRKPKEAVWQPADDAAGGWLLVLSVIITVIAALVVFFMVFWK